MFYVCVGVSSRLYVGVGGVSLNEEKGGGRVAGPVRCGGKLKAGDVESCSSISGTIGGCAEGRPIVQSALVEESVQLVAEQSRGRRGQE